MTDSSQSFTEPVDLSNCEREPIHIPGTIQAHGVLLAFDPASLKLVQWSRNFPELIALDDPAGRSLSDVFDAESARFLLETLASHQEGIVTPVRLVLADDPDRRVRSGMVHRYDGVFIVEFEAESDPLGGRVSFTEPIASQLKRSSARILACPGIDELFQVIAEEVQALSGFDRVMIYQFLEDGHGAVVGEAVVEGIEPFLGLHYPASDIPPQARRLYTVNTIRLIADVNEAPVPIDPVVCPIHGRPLDLTYSSFRSVSPIHIEYLQNMGVSASMSISILRGNDLWGLIACHHYSPRFLSLERRTGCELLGTMAGSYLSTRSLAEDVKRLAERQRLLGEALRQATEGDTFRDGLVSALPAFQQVANAEGAALCMNDQAHAIGLTPPVEDLCELAESLVRTSGQDLGMTDHLAGLVAEGRRWVEEASGVLWVRIGVDPGDCMLFFRPEYTREVSWGGNPQKPVVQDEDGIRLSPRKSFDLWKETVRERSREWTETDQSIAVELQGGLGTISARRTAELLRINDELARMNADLDAFAYAASHDLKEPLRSLHQTLFFLERELEGNLTGAALDRLAQVKSKAQRMDTLIDALLRLSRVGRQDLEWQTFDLRDAVEEAAEITLTSQYPFEIDLDVRKLPTVRGDFLCVREVFCNLFSNAIKYNDHKVRRILVDAQPLVSDDPPSSTSAPVQDRWEISVRDNGIGIAPEHHQSIFEIFRRLHAADEYRGGSGAGLTIVQKIVERHGGSIRVQSALGSGTTFFFTLETGTDGQRCP